jgi:hypothetical protein
MALPIFGNKGICYQPFPTGYDPSTANQTWIFFGSDVAYTPMSPLWGGGYRNAKNETFLGRRDLDTMKYMGVNLIRLYDWEPRNKHQDFLDACWGSMAVLAPVSNYFLKEGFGNRLQLIPELIKSFSNAQKTDYHLAITGIIIGNEPRISGYTVDQCIQFTKDWVAIEQSQFPSYRKLPIGHPVDFATYGGQYPCWGFWDPLLSALNTDGLPQRLFLAPQTYNTAEYLFQNAESSGQGYVDLTWNRYKTPLLFTEIGLGRDKPNYQSVVAGQLQGCIDYNKRYTDRLPGFCFFQFADKVWKQGTSEGVFGAHSHTADILTTVQYSKGDFTHWDVAEPIPDQMAVDVLAQTPLYDAVSAAYNGR